MDTLDKHNKSELEERVGDKEGVSKAEMNSCNLTGETKKEN